MIKIKLKKYKVVEIDVNTYWRSPFNSICTPKQLKEYTIMDIDVQENRRHVFGRESNKVKEFKLKTNQINNLLTQLFFSFKLNQI